MKKFALFIGCNIPAKVPQYETSARAVLKKLNIDVADIKDFNCCGYPLKNTDTAAWILSSARNIALAEKDGNQILTLCKCCFGSLKKADAMLTQDHNLKAEINNILGREGLKYQGTCAISHYLSVLHHDVTIDELNKKVVEQYKDLKIATHYGCHALRPSDIMKFDDPVSPSLFDNLVNVTGAISIDWPSKLDCCGAPVLGMNDNLSFDLTEKKLSNARKAGADFICVACPWCHMQFDKIQNQIVANRNIGHTLPSILYTQLLGLSLGIEKKELGIDIQESGSLKEIYSKLFDYKDKDLEKNDPIKKKKLKKETP